MGVVISLGNVLFVDTKSSFAADRFVPIFTQKEITPTVTGPLHKISSSVET
jgi:hypothetical protein